MSQRLQLAGLTTRVVGPDDAKLTVVLLHGFGAPGDDLVALAEMIEAPSVRFVFPEAPVALGGMYGGGRAWWPLDLMRLEQEMRTGKLADRRAEIPEGLHEVRAKVSGMLDALDTPDDRIVLGGFSQGAMLSVDVALHRATPPAGLVVMSGTLIAEPEWQPRFAGLANVPVLQSHGRADALLPFAVAESLRDHLRAGGATVEWLPFAGGHEIPRAVLAALGAFLRAR